EGQARLLPRPARDRSRGSPALLEDAGRGRARCGARGGGEGRGGGGGPGVSASRAATSVASATNTRIRRVTPALSVFSTRPPSCRRPLHEALLVGQTARRARAARAPVGPSVAGAASRRAGRRERS